MAARRTNGQVWERIGELTTDVENLKGTIDRNYIESKESDASILLAIKDMKTELTDRIDGHQRALCGRMDKHDEYHEKNEDKWGPAKYIKNHIKQTVIAAVIIGMVLVSVFGLTFPKVLTWIREVNGMIKLSP